MLSLSRALQIGLVEVNDPCATANLLNPDVLNPRSDRIQVGFRNDHFRGKGLVISVALPIEIGQ